MRLEGKTAIIVGAGQSPGETMGNGRATALLFAREGAKVLAVDHRLELAQETAALVTKEGGTCVAFQADVTKEATLKAAVDEAMKLWGRIDILHNNVGVSLAGGDASPDRDHGGGLRPRQRHQPARHHHGLQARAPDHAQAAVGLDHQHLLGRRHFDQLPDGGLQDDQGRHGRLHRAAGPAERRVRRARQLHPARPHEHADGRRHARPRTWGTPRAEVEAARNARVPLRKRMGTGWDVAYAALFLASDEANFITGVGLLVDGGGSLRKE